MLVLLALELALQVDLPGGGRVQGKGHVESEECVNVQRDEILVVLTSSGNDSWSIRVALPCQSSFGGSWLLHLNTGVSVSTNLFEAQPADDEARGLGDQAESTGFRARRLRPRRVEVPPERAPPREAAELPHTRFRRPA